MRRLCTERAPEGRGRREPQPPIGTYAEGEHGGLERTSAALCSPGHPECWSARALLQPRRPARTTSTRVPSPGPKPLILCWPSAFKTAGQVRRIARSASLACSATGDL